LAKASSGKVFNQNQLWLGGSLAVISSGLNDDGSKVWTKSDLLVTADESRMTRRLWGRRANSDDMVRKRKRPRASSLWVDSVALSSIPSLHDLRRKLPYRLFGVLIAYMLQHGTGGLRATAPESVIELVDAQGVRALVAGEGHATPTSRIPVDRVHHAEHNAGFFRPV